MADDIFHCRECDRKLPYYETAKRRDPRTPKFRTICGDCFERITAPSPKASDFNVEGNFKKAGTSSQAAQAAAKAAKLNDTHRKLYRALLTRPMTADEAGEACGIGPFTARPRMSDLVKAGWAEETGERTAPHKGAALRNVYRAVPAEERSAA